MKRTCGFEEDIHEYDSNQHINSEIMMKISTQKDENFTVIKNDSDAYFELREEEDYG